MGEASKMTVTAVCYVAMLTAVGCASESGERVLGGTGGMNFATATGGMLDMGAGGADLGGAALPGTGGAVVPVTGGMLGTGAIVDPGTGGQPGGGACCDDGDCLCHGPDPSALTSSDGTFAVDSYDIATGKVFYPTDAEPPFAAIAICPGFTNSGPEMEPWGPFYASHGFVMVAVHTIGSDVPSVRATKLLAAIEELEAENAKAGSPLFEKLSGRFGTSGYSMGGGGTTIASGTDSTLMTSVGLAAWGPDTAGVTVPTLLLCGTSDGTAPCRTSQGAYDGLPGSTPKMMVSINGASHFSWFSPTGAGNGISGQYALAFQKVYLAGDTRWKSLLLTQPGQATMETNIQ